MPGRPAWRSTAAFLDAKEKDISSREENLAATLRGKDEELEGVVWQCTKELEDKHMVALDVLSSESAAHLNKVADNLAAASTAKTDLDQHVAKLTEDLAGSPNEIAALKEGARKAGLF